jgi:uncharacterized protein YcaQ
MNHKVRKTLCAGRMMHSAAVGTPRPESKRSAMPTPSPIADLRAYAVASSLVAPEPLAVAIERLGFVQADPIRAPARAQDLILRQRVADYRAGDLERRYPELGLDEEYLYAYGFAPPRTAALLHPRRATRMSALEKRILALLETEGALHPRDLDARVGRGRVVNAWGGYSTVTKAALEILHESGRTRVVRRERGIRVYGAVTGRPPERPARERFADIVLLLIDIHEPVSERTLFALTMPFRSWRGADHAGVVRALVDAGRVERTIVDGVRYLRLSGPTPPAEEPRSVRLLAPFDPVVWDRARFEHFWGWPYRFEAYVPPAKRVRGYYALPLLWGDAAIGWANARVDGGVLDVDVGFASARPRERAFARELDAEIARLETFLGRGSALVLERPLAKEIR